MGRKRRRLRVTPSWLPVIRDHLVTEIRRHVMAGNVTGDKPLEQLMSGLYGEADALASASLWWVSRDMCKVLLAQVESGELPPFAGYPTVSGFLVWESPVRCMTDSGQTWVNGVAWRVGKDDVRLRIYGICDGVEYRLFDTSLPFVPLDEVSLGVFPNLVKTTLSLMSEPRISDVVPARWKESRDGPRPLSMEAQSSKVKMIVLRKPKQVRRITDYPTMRKRRPCGYRYFVRGFWRNQPYGPDHSLRRRQWVPPFLKGPEGAELVLKESVNVWTRL